MLRLYKSAVRPHLEYCTAAVLPGAHITLKTKRLLKEYNTSLQEWFQKLRICLTWNDCIS